MKICEDCIKKDVCKFKDEVEKYEKNKLPFPEPFMETFPLTCKYKETRAAVTYIPYYVPYPYYYYPYVYTAPTIWTEPIITDPHWTMTGDNLDNTTPTNTLCWAWG